MSTREHLEKLEKLSQALEEDVPKIGSGEIGYDQIDGNIQEIKYRISMLKDELAPMKEIKADIYNNMENLANRLTELYGKNDALYLSILQDYVVKWGKRLKGIY
jgi:hypothetical protein